MTGADLADQLARIASEMEFSRDLLAEVEAAAGALAAAAGTRAPLAARASLQTVDRLDQRLAGMARWLQVLAEAAPPAPLSGDTRLALQTIPLGELRLAMGIGSDPSGPTMTAAPARGSAPGSMEMF